MRDDEFEWDDRKAARNVRDHGITFEEARAAFDDPDNVEEDDADPDEERYKRLCRLNQDVLMVVYTERGNRIRILSARPANKHEQRTYFRR
jgi:uncharacterized DUF497 family protein